LNNPIFIILVKNLPESAGDAPQYPALKPVIRQKSASKMPSGGELNLKKSPLDDLKYEF
jgi:hypothetical protein